MLKRLFVFLTAVAVLLPTIAFYTASSPARAETTKLVAFTFDDGPSDHTTVLLDGLQELDAKATFFVNGVNGSMGIANHKDKLRRMVADGHQIANHTYAHKVPFDGLTAEEMQSQVNRVDASLYELMGDRYQTLVRTPGGATSKLVYETVQSPIILWDVDTLDWKYRNEDSVYNTIMNRVRDGSVVLLHDIYATSVAGALRAMKELKEQGYEMVTVSEMFRRRDVRLESGKSYLRAYNPGVDKGPLKTPTITVDVSGVSGRSTITITSPDENMTYYYTTDGTMPTPASKRYQGTFETTAGTTVTAIAVDAFGTRTATVSATVKQQFAGVFDAAYYLKRYPALKDRYGTDETLLLNHFLVQGIKENHQASPVFSIEYYMTKYPDLKAVYGENRMAYVLHFVHKGMSEGRRGCEEFDPLSYRLYHKDLRRSCGEDWNKYYMHYIRIGYAEKRIATNVTEMNGFETVYNGIDYAAVYDYNEYVANHPAVKKSFGYDDAKTLQFFVEQGMQLQHQASDTFSVTSYYYRYPDLRRAYATQWDAYYRHYIAYGKRENRTAVGCMTMQQYVTVYRGMDYAAVYDYNEYVARYPELQTIKWDEYAVLRHFATYGIRRGYRASHVFAPQQLYHQRPLYRHRYGVDWQAYYYHRILFGI